MKLSLYPKIKNKYAYFAYYGMRILVLLSAVIFVLYGNWASAISAGLIFFLMLLPRLIKSRYEIEFPFGLELAIVGLTFLSVFLGSLHDYYERFPLWDSILHFQSGLLLGIVGFVAIYLLNSNKKGSLSMSPLFVSFFSVCFSLAISVVWEVYEYAGDSWFGYTMQESGLPDTMGDLIVNGSGAIIVAVSAYYWMKKRKKLPFTPDDDNITVDEK